MPQAELPLSLDARLLKLLFFAGSAYTSKDALVRELGESRETIRERLDVLRHCGYPIENHAHFGIRLGDVGDVLCADEILGRLGECGKYHFNWRMIHLRETKSTMDIAHREGTAGAPQGLVVLAEEQTGGRGRQGKIWNSSARLGLYLSLVFRPPWPPEEMTRLTLILSLAAAEAVESVIGQSVRIKWPNDLMIGGKKIAGLLTEAHYEGQRLRFAVAGIGLNVNHQSDDFPEGIRALATSLSQVTRKSWRRADLVVAILQKLSLRYADTFSEVSRLWSERCLTLGQNVKLQTPSGEIQGQAVGLDLSGALLVRRESGQVDAVTSGLLV